MLYANVALTTELQTKMLIKKRDGAIQSMAVSLFCNSKSFAFKVDSEGINDITSSGRAILKLKWHMAVNFYTSNDKDGVEMFFDYIFGLNS